MFKGKKLITLLVSLIAASLLWLYVVTTVAPETTIRVNNIPISLDGSTFADNHNLITVGDKTMIITGQDATYVNLEIKTSRENISKLNAGMIRISANVGSITGPGESEVDCNVIWPAGVRSSSVEILSKSRETVKITVSELETVTLPITPKFSGNAGTGFSAETGSAILNPATVDITGPAEEIAEIQEVDVYFDITESMNGKIEVPLSLVFLNQTGEVMALSRYCTTSIRSADLSFNIYKVQNLKLAVDFISGGGLTEEDVEVVLNPDTLQVKGMPETIDNLGESFVVGEVDLSTVLTKMSTTLKLKLPENVINMEKDKGDEVNVTIKLNGTTTYKANITKFVIVNEMEGYDAVVTTRSISALLRGSQQDIEQLRAMLDKGEDPGLWVEVDLQNSAQTGSFTVAKWTVKCDRFPGIGPVKTGDEGIDVTQTLVEEPPVESDTSVPSVHEATEPAETGQP